MGVSSTRKGNGRTAVLQVGDDDLADAILRAIRRIIRKTSEHSRKVFHESGLTVPQLLCLQIISDAKRDSELTAAELAERVQLSPATISRLLDRLESAELIVRTRSKSDRRRVQLSATRQGRLKLRKLPAPLQEKFLQQLLELPESKRRALLRSLEQVVDMMGASGLEVAPMLTPEVNVKQAN